MARILNKPSMDLDAIARQTTQYVQRWKQVREWREVTKEEVSFQCGEHKYVAPEDGWVSDFAITSHDSVVTSRIKTLLAEKHPQTFEEAIDLVLQVEKEVLIQRHKKYGKENIKADGVYGCIIRDGDKDSRKRNYYKKRMSGEKVKDNTDPEDSLDDSFIDGANYNSIALMYAYGLWMLPLASKE